MNSYEEELYLANDDLESAQIMSENKKFSKACFFAQQAVEKYFKAFLKSHHKFDSKTHKTHNLILLFYECQKIDYSFNKLNVKELTKLNQYSVDVRYNYDFAMTINFEEAKEAIEIAEKVKEFVLRKLERRE